MPKRNKAGMIDGFSSVQAVRRAKQPESPPPLPTAQPPPSTHEKSHEKRIDHTAMPTRHEVVCYSCAYAFTITGNQSKVFCPKCRAQLETGDFVIDEEWTDDIRTMGVVQISSAGCVRGATIIATDIIIGGDATEATLEPTRAIILDTGAKLDLSQCDSRALVIREGARVVLDAILACDQLTIRGELTARVKVSGKAEILPAGFFRGELSGSQFTIHDGGGAKARVSISPQQPTETL